MKRYKLSTNRSSSFKVYLLTFITFLTVCPQKCMQTETPPRYFTSEPHSQNIVAENSLKIVSCRAGITNPREQYRWMKDGTYITDFSLDGYSHRMHHVSRADAGMYRCVAKNNLGAIRSNGENVVIAYMDPFPPQTDQQIDVRSGEGVVINLPTINSVPDHKQIQIQWFVSGVAMIPEAQNHQITLQKNLAILSRSFQDNGKIYKAEAFNINVGQTNTTHNFILRVADTGEGTTVTPSILVGPSNTTAKKSDRKAQLECVFNARPLSQLQTRWYKVGDQRTEILANNKYIFETAYKRVLTIKAIEMSDMGQYECEAVFTNNGQTTNKAATAYLTVIEAPLISTSQIQSHYTKVYGDSLKVDCIATGNPSPTITWYFNAAPVSTIGNNRLSVTPAGSLLITDLDLSDSGMYQCFATNEAGETKTNIWLTVDKSPPAFITPPTNLTLVEGTDARFPCHVSGAPIPVIVWKKTKDNVESEVTSGGRYQINVQTGELLIITTQPSDSAAYSCNATNSQGSIAAEAYLNVYQRTQITTPPPAISEVVKGSVAILQCGASHDVNVNVTWTWYKDLNPLNSDSRITIEQDGTLKILGVYSADNGIYKCEVTSAGGNDSRTTTLKVIELPYRPVITSIAVPPTALKSANISFTPGPNGNTPIERFIFQKRMVTYYPDKGVTMGPEEGWETHPQDVLPTAHYFVMPNLRPARYFQFRISSVNKVGEGPPSEAKPDPPLLMPIQPPEEAPRGFYGSPRSNSSIMLNWQAPPEDTWNGDLVTYTVRYRLKGYTSPFLESNTSAWPATSFELRGLIVFTEYEIKIAAYNNAGVGVYSDSIYTRTREGVPGAPPTDVNITSVNSTAVKIVWLPPDASKINGVNLGYIILASGADNLQKMKTVPPDPNDPYNYQTSYLYDLKKFTDYTITIRCYTGQGQGPASTPFQIKTEEDVPEEVASLTFTDIFDTSVKVIWQPPTEINGILTGYTLLWEKKSQPNTKQDINLSNTTLTYTVRDLDPTTKYTIYIYGKTSKGNGKMSSADFESGVPPERPGTPYNLGISDIQARSALLQFLLGYDGKTSITLWKIQGQIDNNATWIDVYEISDPDARTILVPKLRPFTNYRLRIAAVNIVGRSNFSIPSRKFQTAQAPPNVPPDNVTVRAINSTALRISWAPLSQLNWNGYPRGYEMMYKRIDQANFIKQNLDTDSESYTLNKLEEWMQYEVKMSAFNDVGSSPYSPVSMERTRDAKPSAGPVSVGAVAVSSTSINVTWRDVPLFDRNGIILGYRVVYKSLTENIKTLVEDVPGNETYSVLLTDLRKFVDYQIQVLAYTRMGDGIQSVPVLTVKTHEDVPGPPTKIWFPEVTYSTATVVWEPPTQPNGILTGYLVSYKEKNGNFQGNSSDLPVSQKEYTVATLQREQYYIFKVMAKTRLGWGQPKEVLVYTIINRKKPDKPMKPQITSEVQARNVTISWQPAYDGYGPIRNYTIQYKSEGLPWTDFRDSIPPSSSSYTVTRLHPNTRYNFRVAATNDIGTSNYSDPSDEVRTRQDIPEGAPQNLEVKPLTTDSIHVTWEAPPKSLWNSDRLNYTVCYREYFPEGPWIYRPDTYLYSYVIVDLHPKTYEFRVRAVNSLGYGPWSPSYVKNIELGTEVFHHPDTSTWNGALLGYLVQYRKADMSSYQEKSVQYPTHDYTLNDLVKYVNYEVRIIAFNSVGEGPASTITSVYVGEAAPSAAPINISTVPQNSTQIKVLWDPPPPETHNGELSGYKVAYWLASAAPSTALLVIVREKQALLNNLQTYTMYYVTVQAYNLAGEGPKSSSISSRTKQGIPGIPGPIEFLNVTMTTVNVTWSRPQQPNGVINAYELAYKQQQSSDGSRLTQLTIPGNREYVLIDKLEEGRTYDFSVKAVTSIGAGVETKKSITMGPQPGSPGRPGRPIATVDGRNIILKWDMGDKGDGPIIAYYVQAVTKDSQLWTIVHVKYSNAPQSAFSWPSMCKDTGCQFSVVAINYKGISPASEPTQLIKQVEPVKSFHNEWWFLVIALLAGLVVILVVTSLLCLVARRNRRDKKTTAVGMSNQLEPIEPEEGGFSTLDRNARQSQRNIASIRNGFPRTGTLPRSVPRPSPASVTYSESDIGATPHKGPLPDDDDDGSSDTTQKPSDIDSSEPSDDDSDLDDKPLPPPPPPLPEESPPPPPFRNRSTYVNDYADDYQGHQQHHHPHQHHQQQQQQQPQRHQNHYNAYNYTDSEASSSHYGLSLNSGQIVINNSAGSRAPLPGFSSFV